MDNRHDAPYSPGSPELGQHYPAKINFDGTKLRIERSRPKTTTYGMNCYFQADSISQNRAESRPSQPDLPILVDMKRRKGENSADGGTPKTLMEQPFKPDSGRQTAVSYPGRKATTT